MIRSLQVRVKLRRGDSWKVKPEAEQLDGQIIAISDGWVITEEDSSLYIGEFACCLDQETRIKYPDAPSWIASGDIELLALGEYLIGLIEP